MRPVSVIAIVLLLMTAGAVVHTQTTATPAAADGTCCASGGDPIGPPGPAGSGIAKIAGAKLSEGPRYLMGAAHVPGFNSTQWRTSLEVCNFGGVNRSYGLAFLHRDQGNPDPETVDLDLAPGLCVNYPDVVATVFGLDEAVGTLRLDPDGDGVVSTARTYNDTPDGTYGTALGSNEADSAVGRGEKTALIHLSQSAGDTAGYRTNLDLLNVAGSEIDVEIALHEADGIHLGDLTVHLDPFEYRQMTKVFRGVTGREVADGYAVIQTNTAGGTFMAAASLVDNQTGDSTTITAAGVPSSERWLEAKNIGPTINSAGDDWYPVLARDGSFMIFVSQGRGGYGSGDLYISRFEGGEWQPPENMGPNINTAGFESAPSLTHDERTLYFTSNDQGIGGSFDVWSCPLNDGVPGPRSKVSGLNTRSIDCCPVPSADGRFMYICSDRAGTFGSLDVWVSEHVGGAWQPPVNLGEIVNSSAIDSPRWISDDGNTLIFDSSRYQGGFGSVDLWYIVKSGAEWLEPVNLGPPINSWAIEQGPGFLGNNGEIGGRIFFGSGRQGGLGGWDIWYSDFGSPVAAKAISAGGHGPVQIPNITTVPSQADADTPAMADAVPGGSCSGEALK